MAIFPKVSIITPSYNQAHYLEECIISVLEQDYPNIEYIIMDGGSTDGSVEIIKKYDDRIAYWVSQPDDGQSAALNQGLRCATGEIWAWMNADDAYLPGAVSKAVVWLESHPQCDIIYGDCQEIDENGRILIEYHAPEFEIGSVLTGRGDIPSGSTFLHRRVWERVGGFDESLHFVMDVDYWFRASLITSFRHLPEILSKYRIYSSAKTWDLSRSAARGREFVRMYESFWSRPDLPARINRHRARSLVEVYLYAAHLAGNTNDRTLCYQYVQKSLQMGAVALRPRLVRLLVYLLFGKRTENLLQKITSRRLRT